MRRLFWIGVGAAAGASGTIWTQRRVKEQLDNLGPETVVAIAGKGARAIGRTVNAAVSEGRAAMAEREGELTRRRDGAATRPMSFLEDRHESRRDSRADREAWPTSTERRLYR